MKIKFTHAVMASLLFCLWGGTSYAMPMTYTDHSVFFNDLISGGFYTETSYFDNLSDGQTIASGETVASITFDYDFGGVQMMVSNIYGTTSPPNFLGTDDGDVFQDGDDIDLSFSATRAIGMYFLTADNMFDDDIMLTDGDVTASLLASDIQQTLADGTDVYFLGIISNTYFMNASIITAGGGNFLYNIDDITSWADIPVSAIPEPGTAMLFLIGMLGVFTRKLVK